jgi:hypothetical protein
MPIWHAGWKIYYNYFSDKAPINRINFNIVYGCNLGCDYCSHLSQLDHGFVPLETLRQWYQTWSKKITPYRVSLLGGEPFLHPQFVDILLETKYYFKDAIIDVLSNGLLLSKKPDNIFKTLKVINAVVYLTKHFDDPMTNELFEAGIAKLKQFGIPYNFAPSYVYWLKMYHQKEDIVLPYNSDFKKAWDNCGSKNSCLTIDDNCLFKCAALSAYYRLASRKKLPEEWNRVLNYKPLTENATRNEILQHITSGAMPECSVCPEKYEQIPISEISSNFHKIGELKRRKK